MNIGPNAADGAGTTLLLGAGRMGGAMLRGWLAQGVPASAISVADPSPAPDLAELAARTGVRLNPADSTVVDTLVVAVKPQMVESAAAGVQAVLVPHTLVLSIMAGKTLADLRRLFPAAGSVVRAMPNLPAAVGRGATVAVAEAGCPADRKARAASLLTAVGSLEWLADEALVDAATALSGSGPAYVFYLVECLTRAGVEVGLPADVSERLARATVEGAGALMGATGQPAAELRAGVTSPGGTTAAGLSKLMADDHLQSLLNATLRAAAQRAAELGGTGPKA
ncbi:pyrroline-5-carboxylate reductase [Azospirillum formosense]|uniref:Pyrroline-5-carboxylate reductase n=1 Tax=Azospirillum formosense TaxID=861533 RepID=A0ABX2KTY5_9PROT|nr:pyrroline-5-carboxylate reductase [Azospirillum formosense]MBY3756407.1 pyrroline-5-carboxylate reductase [Azospirillum formosense]NUB20124.1 pyrroline-5-carboxylate reductase [Azospirillum formosense]